ncbi:cell division protein PerM [Streptomonospora nanhaiensis]|uniref:cell division protein PerM n=1 Tax=Streptomonospora nanhaiensis TaxID=1323731 RepID=UPI0037433D1F
MGRVSAPARPSPNRSGGRPRREPSQARGAARAPRGRRPPPADDQPRPLYTAGGLAAAWSAGIGLAVLMTLTVAGWVAAPHGAFGEDIGEVLRAAVQAWLVGHHVGFTIPGGGVSLLPLGLVVLPGLLLYRAGRWLARSCELPRLRHLFRAALAIAGPYAAIAGTLALVGRTEVVRPSVVQALIAGFGVAFVAGGAGVLFQLLKDKGIPKRRLLDLMPDRPRSLLVGTLSATGTLLATGALLFGAALASGMDQAAALTGELAPGLVGGALLLLVQLLYLPNAVVFGLAYAVGPGFAVGTGTVVAPTGVSVGAVPILPMLAALPDNGPAPVVSLAALAVPFLAGAVGGVLTQRSAPAVVSESAPLWGFVCGVTTGLVCAALSLLAGGSMGAERLSEVGPSAWQVGLITALEVGLAAAIAAWVANWRYYRRAHAGAAPDEAGAEPEEEEGAPGDEPPPAPARRRGRPVLRVVPDPGDAEPAPEPGPRPRSGPGPVEQAPPKAAPRWRLRLPALRLRRRRAADDDGEEFYGITYEADSAPAAPADDGPGR